MDTGRYLSKKKAARRLDVSEKTIDRLRQAGELQAIKVRGCVRITLASLLAYETRQEQAAEPTPPPPSRLPVRNLSRRPRRRAGPFGSEASAASRTRRARRLPPARAALIRSTAALADLVYWSNNADSAIRSAPLAGGGYVDTLYEWQMAAGPRGIAIHAAAGKIYWSSQGDSAIRCAPLGGGFDDRLYGPSGVVSGPGGVAIDPAAERIYWANEVDNTIRGGPLAGGSVANALYDAHSGVNGPGAVAIDPAGGRIYWTNPGDNTIRRGKLAGGFPPDTLYGSSHGVNGPVDLAIDVAGGRIYWTNSGDYTIRGAPLTIGGGVAVLYDSADGVSGPSGIAIDPPEPVFSIIDESGGSTLAQLANPVTNWLNQHWPGKRPAGRVYWANHEDNKICGAPLDGSGPVDILYDGANRGVYWPNFVAVLQAPLGAGPPAISSVGQSLRCSRGTWSRDLLGAALYRSPQSFRFQWTLNGTDIAGATLSAYTPSAPGSYTCRVTATNPAGSTAQTSAPVSIS